MLARCFACTLILTAAACTEPATAPIAARPKDRAPDATTPAEHPMASDGGREPKAGAAAPDRPDASADAAAPSSPDAAPADAAPADAAEPATQLIRAADGGEIVGLGGRVVVRIPPGALTADAELRIVPAQGVSWGPPDFGFAILPSDVGFDPPAELRVEVESIEPLAPWLALAVQSKEPAAWEKWNRLEGPRDGAWLSVPITRANTFGLAWEARGLPDDCPIKPGSFTACGGDITGEWTLEGICHADGFGIVYEQPSERFPSDGCDVMRAGGLPENEPYSVLVQGVDEWPLTGSLTVENGRFVRSRARAVIPLVPALRSGCLTVGSTCEDVGALVFGRTDGCPGTEWCTCQHVHQPEIDPIDAALTLEGTTLRLDDGPVLGYCVDGEQLRVLEQGPIGPQVMVYRR